MCRIKTKVWAQSEKLQEMVEAIHSELKSTRASSSDVAVVLTHLLKIAKKVTSTRWALKVKSHRNLKASQVVVESRLSADLMN